MRSVIAKRSITIQCQKAAKQRFQKQLLFFITSLRKRANFKKIQSVGLVEISFLQTIAQLM